ncbi:DUF4209 domain-containing protein, partial [Patescibacteria group bacterium]|nr:DUF4209 domain-containing protein [Patescibacteria group bacterium]
SAEEILKVGKEKIFALERIRRSISLARIIRYKKQNDAFMKIQSFVEDLDLENIIFIRIIEMLLQNNFHPNKKFLEKAKKKYEKYIEDKDYVTAERYCELIVDWYRLLKDDDFKRSAQIDLANILILRAEQNVESGNYIAATLFLKEAILAFNNIEGTEIEREKLRKKLLNYQSKLSNNLSSVEISINLEDYANRAKARIMGKSKEDAIIELAFIDGIPNKEYIRKQTERTQSPLLTFISREIINENGRTIATNSPSINTSEEEKEKSLEEDMFSYVSNYERGVRVEGIIKPSLYQLNFEHNIYETDLDFIVKDNPFIPKDRRLLFRRGLYAGFKSDYVISTHILGLQIENSIRYVLNNEGVITTSLNTEGIQEEIDLNRLLDFKELIPIFGEDLIFDLKGLLISRFGDNLRNRIAHGLLSSNNFFSQSVIYLWWLMLKICAFPLYRENKSKE